MESYIHVTETTYYVRGTRYYLLLYPLGTRYILLLLTDTRYIILILLSTYLGLAIALAHETSPHPHPYARILEVPTVFSAMPKVMYGGIEVHTVFLEMLNVFEEMPKVMYLSLIHI